MAQTEKVVSIELTGPELTWLTLYLNRHSPFQIETELANTGADPASVADSAKIKIFDAYLNGK